MFWGLLGAPGTAERIVVSWTAGRSRSHGSGAEFGWRPSMLAVPHPSREQRLGRARERGAVSQRPLVGTSKFEAHRISSICSCGRACADIALTHVPSFRVRGDEMAEILRGVSMRRCGRCRRCRTLEGRPAQRLRTLDLNLLVCRAASPRRRTIHDSCSAGCCSAPVGSDKCAHVRPDKMPGIAAGLSSNETAQKSRNHATPPARAGCGRFSVDGCPLVASRRGGCNIELVIRVAFIVLEGALASVHALRPDLAATCARALRIAIWPSSLRCGPTRALCNQPAPVCALRSGQKCMLPLSES